jgi:hypothetical protein
MFWLPTKEFFELSAGHISNWSHRSALRPQSTPRRPSPDSPPSSRGSAFKRAAPHEAFKSAAAYRRPFPSPPTPPCLPTAASSPVSKKLLLQVEACSSRRRWPASPCRRLPSRSTHAAGLQAAAPAVPRVAAPTPPGWPASRPQLRWPSRRWRPAPLPPQSLMGSSFPTFSFVLASALPYACQFVRGREVVQRHDRFVDAATKLQPQQRHTDAPGQASRRR